MSGGPREIILTYRCGPSDRPALRGILQKEMAESLGRLKREGTLSGFEILFNSFDQPRTWDAMAILSFSSFSATQRWKEIERTAPGGLPKSALKLVTRIETDSGDLSWQGGDVAPEAAAKTVYYVIPYEYQALDQYKKYIDGYVIPQTEGWLKDGALARYRILLNRYPVGPNWDSLFIYQYRDLESFGRRDEVLKKTREPLREDPTWKQLNEIKQTIRTESENTIAEVIAIQ